jgi:hypothetical protein
MTKAIVHLIAKVIAAPHTDIANRLNMLPIFSPVAFWYAKASALKLDES